MTTSEEQDEIIEWALEANIGDATIEYYKVELEAFAKLVDAKATAKEREACAKLIEVSDDVADWEIICGSDGRELLNAMAKAIRARGNT